MSGPEQHHHLNPDYYAETASLYATADGQQHGQDAPPPQYQQHLNNYYPPPPGPPPAEPSGENPPPKPPRPAEQQQQYYAAPPPIPEQSGGSTSSSASSKPTLKERLYQWSTKAGVPINNFTNKLGSEAFWPSTMDIECDKAARILKSFCS